MAHPSFTGKCVICKDGITEDEKNYSLKKYGHQLCRTCQRKIDGVGVDTTQRVLKLYARLLLDNVPVKIEFYDGHKRIDMRIMQAKLDIEVDGEQHSSNAVQAYADIMRTYYSYEQGHFYTLRIPTFWWMSGLMSV